MGENYLQITKGERSLAVVDFTDKANPVISLSGGVLFYDLRDVVYKIEEYIKRPW